MASAIEHAARQLVATNREHAVENPIPSMEGVGKIRAAFLELIEAIDIADGVKDRQEYIDAAQRLLVDEGEVEVDDDAVVSPTEGGAYVQAWVYVEREEL